MIIRNCQSLTFNRAHDWNSEEIVIDGLKTPKDKVKILSTKPIKRDPTKLQKISIIEIKDSFEKIKKETNK